MVYVAVNVITPQWPGRLSPSPSLRREEDIVSLSVDQSGAA